MLALQAMRQLHADSHNVAEGAGAASFADVFTRVLAGEI